MTEQTLWLTTGEHVFHFRSDNFHCDRRNTCTYSTYHKAEVGAKVPKITVKKDGNRVTLRCNSYEDMVSI